MRPRERVMISLEHREPDRVPIDYWAVPEVTERLKRHFGFQEDEELLRHLGVDLRYVRGPSYIGLELREHRRPTTCGSAFMFHECRHVRDIGIIGEVRR